LEQELISCSFAGSPVQLSSVPSAKGTLARFKIRTNAFVMLYHQNYLHNLPKIVLQVVFLGLISIVGTIKFSDISYFFIQLAH
jgi:hypothetical protein